MKQLIKEIIEETKNGKILIDGDEFLIGFNTIIYKNNEIKYSNNMDNGFPTLIIKDEDKFCIKMLEYLNLFVQSKRKTPNFISDVERNTKKLILSYIFANATTEDFSNSLYLIDRNINFLTDVTFENLNNTPVQTHELNCFNHSFLEIKNQVQSVFMETPNKMTFTLKKTVNNREVIYKLPSISYGISVENGKKVCYIYSLINPKPLKEKTETQIYFDKKISRELYKLNSGVRNQESEEYLNNSDDNYFSENISDISPSTLISITSFLSLLKNKKIDQIKVVPYLPIRFLSREIFSNNNSDKELMMRNDFIQKNITDKFIRSFRRMEYHYNNININSYPYEFDEFMNINLLNNVDEFNNDILSEIHFSVFESLIKNRSK